jgi:hypothetical protein
VPDDDVEARRGVAGDDDGVQDVLGAALLVAPGPSLPGLLLDAASAEEASAGCAVLLAGAFLVRGHAVGQELRPRDSDRE